MAIPCSLASLVGLMVVLTLGPIGRGEAAEATLRWKLKAGETLRYEFRQKNSIKVKTNAQETDNTTELAIDLSWKVKAVDKDGTAEVALRIDRVKSEYRLGPQTIKYDSREPAGDEPGAKALGAVYGAAIGEDYALEIDARGRVVEAAVPPKVTEALQGSPFLAWADGGSVLSEKGLKSLFAQLIPALPEKPVDKGAAWRSSLDVLVQPMRLSLTYKDQLVALDSDSARVDSTIETTIKPEANSPFTVDLKKQSGNRSVTFDVTTGRVKVSTVKQSLELGLGIMNREIEQVIVLDEQLKLVP